MAHLGQADFKARIKRINNPRNISYFDPELQMHVPKRTSHVAIKRTVKARKFSPSRVILSLLIGVVAVVVAQVLRLRYLGMTEPGNAALLTDLLLTAFFVLLTSAILRHRKPSLRIAQVVGVFAVIVAGHNLMWAYPAEMAVLYTTDYVGVMHTQTAPSTLAFAGLTVGF